MSLLLRRTSHIPLRPILLLHHHYRHPASATVTAPTPTRSNISQCRSLHETSSRSDSRIGRWLRRANGMRRTIGAWAENFGIIEPSSHNHHHHDERERLDEVKGEELFVMPGWAVVKYRPEKAEEGAPKPFDIDLSISGYCAQARSPSKVTRSQRIMTSVVRRFASLPSINPEDQPMGPIPTAVGMALLEEGDERDQEEMRKAEEEKEKQQVKQYSVYKSKRQRALQEGGSSGASSTAGINANRPAPPSRTNSLYSVQSTDTAFTGKEAVIGAHRNLQIRTAPFWSSILPNRRILLDIYAIPPPTSSSGASNQETKEPPAEEHALFSFELTTDGNGHFTRVLTIPWETLCTNPPSVAMAFEADESQKTAWMLKIRARLDYEVFDPSNNNEGYRSRIKRAIAKYGEDASDGLDGIQEGLKRVALNSPGEPQVVQWTEVRIGSAKGVHIISDLDDTVKHSDILSGPREVFRPLEEICVPQMNAMYRRLDDAGIAGFHFVSNSPSQLFPSIRDFLLLNDFPNRHSIKLKYYGGRSIFSSLYESPAERKRASLRELFDSFPLARFVMLGDSAEQDLELYVEFARAYKGRVAMIAIRDVTSERVEEVYAAMSVNGVPTPSMSVNDLSLDSEESMSKSSVSSGNGSGNGNGGDASRGGVGISPTGTTQRPAISRQSSVASTDTASIYAEAAVTEEDLQSLSSSQRKILQRAATWQTRMEKARVDVPQGTEVIFFTNPLEIESKIEGTIKSTPDKSEL